ncbi:hypothetical protein [Nocardia sp. NPDC058497]
MAWSSLTVDERGPFECVESPGQHTDRQTADGASLPGVRLREAVAG